MHCGYQEGLMFRKTSVHVLKTCREQKWNVLVRLVKRPRPSAYLFSETHMCMDTISSQLKMEQAQRLQELNCLFQHEKLGRICATWLSVSGGVSSTLIQQFPGLSGPLCSISAQPSYSCTTSSPAMFWLLEHLVVCVHTSLPLCKLTWAQGWWELPH